MMRSLVLAALAGSALAIGVGLAATAKPASEDSCFLTRDLRGHTIGTDGHTLYFGVNGRNTYQVTTSNACLAMVTGSDALVLRDLGLGKICRPLDMDISVRGTRCFVSKLTKLTPQEASSLPKKLQP
jgi:hypothetical protein